MLYIHVQQATMVQLQTYMLLLIVSLVPLDCTVQEPIKLLQQGLALKDIIVFN